MTATGSATAAPSPLGLLLSQPGRRAALAILLPLMLIAALAWVMTFRDSPAMDAGALLFVASWVSMMVAMMLPGVAPVVGLYIRASQNVVAAAPFFVAGYLSIWSLSAIPAYAVNSVLADPLMQGQAWVGRLTGAVLLAAAAYELSPLKSTCLRHCRAPVGFFRAHPAGLDQAGAALAAGCRHALYCLGCCAALMAVLIVLGGMQLAWALTLSAIVTVQKLAPRGETVARVVAAAAVTLGVALVVAPGPLTHIYAT
jgi:predicted metal-binding membrane protein